MSNYVLPCYAGVYKCYKNVGAPLLTLAHSSCVRGSQCRPCRGRCRTLPESHQRIRPTVVGKERRKSNRECVGIKGPKFRNCYWKWKLNCTGSYCLLVTLLNLAIIYCHFCTKIQQSLSIWSLEHQWLGSKVTLYIWEPLLAIKRVTKNVLWQAFHWPH